MYELWTQHLFSFIFFHKIFKKLNSLCLNHCSNCALPLAVRVMFPKHTKFFQLEGPNLAIILDISMSYVFCFIRYSKKTKYTLLKPLFKLCTPTGGTCNVSKTHQILPKPAIKGASRFVSV